MGAAIFDCLPALELSKLSLMTTQSDPNPIAIGAPLQRSSASTGSSEFGAKTAGFQRNGHNNRNALPLGAQTWMTTCCRSNKSSARSCFAKLCAFMFYGSATACQGKYLGSVPLQSLLSFEAHAPVGINLQPARSLAHPEQARFGIDSCRAAVNQSVAPDGASCSIAAGPCAGRKVH